MSCTLTVSNLSGFTGSQDFFKHPFFRSVVYTEGVQFIGANGCGWLLDKILANVCHNKTLAKQEFISITMKCNLANKTAVVTFEDGDYKKLLIETIDYTDCTVEEIKFFFTDKVLMLSSEY